MHATVGNSRACSEVSYIFFSDFLPFMFHSLNIQKVEIEILALILNLIAYEHIKAQPVI
jgi:hypothetical protein